MEGAPRRVHRNVADPQEIAHPGPPPGEVQGERGGIPRPHCCPAPHDNRRNGQAICRSFLGAENPPSALPLLVLEVSRHWALRDGRFSSAFVQSGYFLMLSLLQAQGSAFTRRQKREMLAGWVR